MHMIITKATPINGKIVLTHTIQKSQNVGELLMKLVMEVDAAGELARSIQDAIEAIQAEYANILPDKKTPLVVGRSHA